MTSTLQLAGLLVRFRLRSIWNGVWRSPRGRSFRLGWLFVLATPIAYTGLLTVALDTIGEHGGQPMQAAALAVVCGTVVLASVVGKMASSEAVVAGSGENEFFSTKPFGLSQLVLARCLAGTVTNLFDAFFLMPVLVAAALLWRLGAAGIVLAAFISMVVQLGVSAFAQGAQVVLVRVVSPPRRRVAWAALALLGALAMACLWMVATWVLRQPALTVARLAPWADLLAWSPAGAIVAPLVALAQRGWGATLAALARVLLSSALAALVAAVGVGWASRGGWEQAGAPWAEAARGVTRAAGTRRRGGSLGVFGKDWRLVVRDPARLLRLVAMPLVFLGVQVFGSAGWTWSTASASRVALVSFSLCAYAATFGPLAHMEAERRAFWILRSVPVPLGRLMASKAALWSVIIGGMGVATYAALLASSPNAVGGEALVLGALVLGGAITICWLAVAMACGAADFTDDTKSALGLGTVYTFMLVAGLFNVVFLDEGRASWRGAALYLLATALYWSTGIERAASAYDPESRAARRVVAGDGASLAILMFLGQRAAEMGSRATGAPEVVPWVQAGWLAVLGVAAAMYLVRVKGTRARLGIGASLGIAATAGSCLAAAIRIGVGSSPSALGAVPIGVWLLGALVEEIVFRGIVQRALQEQASTGRGRAVAAVLATLLSIISAATPFSGTSIALHFAAAAVYLVSGRLSACLLVRVLVVALGSGQAV